MKQGEDDTVYCHDTLHKENYFNTCINAKYVLYLQPFEMYVLCDNLRTGMGNALVDTGSQVSLATEQSLNTGSVIKERTI
jgi:hypothetical protein